MKISESSVVIQRNGSDLESGLNLREGQKVLAKVVSTSSDEAVLNVAGNIVEAKVEGSMPASGSVCLFEVHLGEDGRIELKILADMESTASGSAVTQLDHLLAAALKEEGASITGDNLLMLKHLLTTIQMQYNQAPDPKVAAFLVANKLPLTSGTLLLSFLQQDSSARDYLWNLLEQSNMLKPEEKLELTGDSQTVFNTLLNFKTQADEELLTDSFLKVIKTLLVLENVAQGTNDTGNNQVASDEFQKVINQLFKTLITNSSSGSSNETRAELTKVVEQLYQFTGNLAQTKVEGEAEVEGRKILDKLFKTLSNNLNQGDENEVSTQFKEAVNQLAAKLNNGSSSCFTEKDAAELKNTFEQLLKDLSPENAATSKNAQANLEKALTEFLEVSQGMTGERELGTGLQKAVERLLQLSEDSKSVSESMNGEFKNLMEKLVQVLRNTGISQNQSGIIEKSIFLQLLKGLKQNFDEKGSLSNGEQIQKMVESLNNSQNSFAGSEQTDNNGNMLPKIAELLTHPMSWGKINDQSDNQQQQLHFGVVPFLIQDSKGTVRECIIHWEESSNKPDENGQSQRIKVLIPTENMGDIWLELTQSPQYTSIRLDVESEDVRSYLLQREDELKQLAGTGVIVRVETTTPKESLEGVDLWM